MTKFRNKFRIESNRLPRWDYSGNGVYFITLVTQHRACVLGEVVAARNSRAEVQLSDFGKIVNNEWIKSFEIRNELFLDEYIIMPNHLHAILIIEKPENYAIENSDKNEKNESTDGGILTKTDGGNSETHGQFIAETHGRTHAETHGRASQSRSVRSPDSGEFVRKPQSISSFIAGFKSAVNSKIDDYIDNQGLDIPKYNRNNHFFQPNYHDHVIRNDIEYQRIKQYIINNPVKWMNDKFKLPDH